MTLVLVNGNPENRHGWDKLLARLDRDDAVVLDVPGMGCPRPEGFGATRWDYKDWLLGELERFGEPVDVVAHSMGAMVTCGLLGERPELIRSFALGTVPHSQFALHERARIWQTTRLGEMVRDTWPTLSLEQRIEVLRTSEIPEDRLEPLARMIDREMIECMLGWYRSAAWTGDWELQPGREYPPGILLWGDRDPYQDVRFGRLTAEAIGAEIVVFDDCGHWWMHDRPDEAAEAIQRFWRTTAANA